MFSVIPANRPCLTDFVTISPTQFAFSFPSSPHFSHLVVFLLPGNILPVDSAAGVYIQLPGSTEFRFLGAIGNEKPSAIFKVNLPGPKHPPPSNGNIGTMTDGTDAPSPQPDIGDINLGISVEPAANIQAQLAALPPPQSNANSTNGIGTSSAMVLHRPPPQTKVLAQRIIKDAFNFLASFAGSGNGGQEVVPLKSFQDWWTKFERRVENDPGFLERVEEGS